MSATTEKADGQLIALYMRALSGDLGAAHVWFAGDVLDRYRALPEWRVMRTNTVGRVRSPDGWSLDFGIGQGEQVIHASLADLAQRLPITERLHWVEHILTSPVSRTFLTMRLAPGSCIDDGDLREWVSGTDTISQGVGRSQ